MIRLTASLLACFATVFGAEAAGLGSAAAQGGAEVVALCAGTDADLVVLSGGYAQGLRPGMVCAVLRQRSPVARIIIAESCQIRAVALVLAVAPGEEIRPGDQAEARAHPRI